jgi:hypothetical protein
MPSDLAARRLDRRCLSWFIDMLPPLDCLPADDSLRLTWFRVFGEMLDTAIEIEGETIVTDADLPARLSALAARLYDRDETEDAALVLEARAAIDRLTEQRDRAWKALRFVYRNGMHTDRPAWLDPIFSDAFGPERKDGPGKTEPPDPSADNTGLG